MAKKVSRHRLKSFDGFVFLVIFPFFLAKEEKARYKTELKNRIN